MPPCWIVPIYRIPMVGNAPSGYKPVGLLRGEYAASDSRQPLGSTKSKQDPASASFRPLTTSGGTTSNPEEVITEEELDRATFGRRRLDAALSFSPAYRSYNHDTTQEREKLKKRRRAAALQRLELN